MVIHMSIRYFFIFVALVVSVNAGEFVATSTPDNIKSFSSERLSFSHPDNTLKNGIINLVSKSEISNSLFSEGEDPIETVQDYFSSSDSLSNGNVNIPYTLPTNMLWGAYDKTGTNLVGLIIGEYISSQYAAVVAPQGEKRDFFIRDIRQNTYFNISYAVDTPYQNKGFSKEMTLALKDMIFNYTNANVLVHISKPTNTFSSKSATSCGFSFEGTREDGTVFRILRK